MKILVTVLVAAMIPNWAFADVWTFETPSENIQCIVGEEPGASDLECTIIEYSSLPVVPRPVWCQSDWGHTFRMRDRGHVEMICAPMNRNKDGFDKAEYGVTGRFGGFTCHSSREGLECSNLDGHGFFLSRSRQRLF